MPENLRANPARVAYRYLKTSGGFDAEKLQRILRAYVRDVRSLKDGLNDVLGADPELATQLEELRDFCAQEGIEDPLGVLRSVQGCLTENREAATSVAQSYSILSNREEQLMELVNKAEERQADKKRPRH